MKNFVRLWITFSGFAWSVPLVAQCLVCDWRTHQPEPIILGLAWNGQSLVSVGREPDGLPRSEGRELAESNDGSVWESKGSFGQHALHSVLWDGGSFFAVGDGGTILRRSDEGNWHSLVSQTRESLKALAWNGEVFVAGGDRGVVVTSQDGLSWTAATLETLPEITNVLWDGERFLIVHAYRVFESPDGQSWQRMDANLPFNPSGVAWNGQTLVAVERINLSFSDDAVNWENILFEGSNFTDVAGNGSEFVAVGTFGTIFYSSDGREWSAAVSGTEVNLNAVTWSENRWWAGGENGLILSSDDGMQWEKTTPGSIGYYFAVAARDDLSIIGESGGQTIFSEDGTRWRAFSATNGFSMRNVVVAGDVFFASSNRLRDFYRSQDGESWTPLPINIEEIDPFSRPEDMAANETAIVAIVSPRVLTSHDFGQSWSVWNSLHGIRSVIWDGARFLILGYDMVFESVDGLQWQPHETNLGRISGHLAWNGKRYVSAGGDGSIHSSPDGYSWTRHEDGFDGRFSDIAAGNEAFVAVGPRGLVYASPDGVSWARQLPDLVVDLNAVTWDGSRFIIVGDEGTLVTGSCVRSTDCDFRSRSVVPWVVNNEGWASRIALLNKDDESAFVQLRAATRDGDHAEQWLTVPPESVVAQEAGALFPDLTGYSLFISATVAELFPSFLTFNLDPVSGGHSPSQTTAGFLGDLTSRLLFGYVPGDQNSALVVVAPDSGTLETEVFFTLHGSEGLALAETQRTLQGNQPLAILIAELFEGTPIPKDASVKAVSGNGAVLAGTTFVFNALRQPSMSAAFSLPPER